MKLNSGIVLLLLTAAAATIGACNIVGPAYYFIHGPEKVPPQFVLPKEKSAVVFIDDRASVLPTRALRQRIARAAERGLLDARAVGKADIIGSDAIMSLSTQERFGKPTGIAEVGKAVGADTVIYATFDQFGLSPDGQEFAPFATLRVKVVDVESRQRLWPTGDREWTNVPVTSLTRSGVAPATTAERSRAEAELADRVGLAIAQLFFEHEQTDLIKRVAD